MLAQSKVLKMRRIQAFVAKTAPDFKNSFHAPDQAFFQINFRREAQINVKIQSVVMSDKRLGQGAGSGIGQNRRFHLNKTMVPVKFP